MDRECSLNGDVHQDIVHLGRAPLDSISELLEPGMLTMANAKRNLMLNQVNVTMKSMIACNATDGHPSFKIHSLQRCLAKESKQNSKGGTMHFHRFSVLTICEPVPDIDTNSK